MGDRTLRNLVKRLQITLDKPQGNVDELLGIIN